MRKTTVKGLKCPECGSTNLVKNGHGIRKRKRVQRYLCNNCLRNTLKPKRCR